MGCGHLDLADLLQTWQVGSWSLLCNPFGNVECNRYAPYIGRTERDLVLSCRYGLDEEIRYGAEVMAENEG